MFRWWCNSVLENHSLVRRSFFTDGERHASRSPLSVRVLPAAALETYVCSPKLTNEKLAKTSSRARLAIATNSARSAKSNAAGIVLALDGGASPAKTPIVSHARMSGVFE